MTPHTAPVAPPPEATLLVVGVLPDDRAALVAQWAATHAAVVREATLASIEALHRDPDPPLLVLLSTAGPHADACDPCLAALKRDARMQTVPAVVLTEPERIPVWLDAGADEALSHDMPAADVVARLTAAVRRSRRDVQVNPSTRLVGSDAISEAISARMARDEKFAACYADLDHFKEFNDRYGYASGDDVIRSVSRMLVETVHAISGARGFVGHIGGDDFLFLVPLEDVDTVCDALVQRADETLPLRYSAHDRQAGYFFGKDRRGRLDRVPLMTLSIGVVTNARRRFTSAAQVSELATEMKTYAKSLPGSVWAMDRRADSEPVIPPQEKHQ